MKDLKPRIEFYRQRNFTEKLNATFDFIRETIRPLLKYSFYVIMPLCLVQTFVTNRFYGIYFTAISSNTGSFANTSDFFAQTGGLMLCILAGGSLIAGLVCALMQTYTVRENRLEGIVLADFKNSLLRNVLRCLGLSLFMFFVYAVFAGAVLSLAAFSKLSLLLTVPLMLCLLLCAIPLMIVVPTYLFERDLTLVSALAKAWKLGTATLWGMLGLMIVLYFVSSVIQTVTSMPYTLSLIISGLFKTSNNPVHFQSALMKFLLYLFGLLSSYGAYLSSMIGVIGLAFQYFHAREKVEGVTIEANIDNFSELGDVFK